MWGTARGYSRVVVRAGGFEKAVKPFGTFLVFLPQATDPKTVTVEVDGKRYARRTGRSSDEARAARRRRRHRRGRRRCRRPGRMLAAPRARCERVADARTDRHAVLAQRIVMRVPDPASARPGAAAERIDPLKDGRPVGNPQTCVQLGRLRDSTFGWFFGDGSFRALGVHELPLQCMPTKWKKPMAQFMSTLAITDPATPKITAGVVWGRFPGASRVTVSGTDVPTAF